jgi:hypothetical protein
LRILLQLDTCKLRSTSPLSKLKKEDQGTAGQLQAPTPGVGQSSLISDTTTMPLQPIAEEGGGENEVA